MSYSPNFLPPLISLADLEVKEQGTYLVKVPIKVRIVYAAFIPDATVSGATFQLKNGNDEAITDETSLNWGDGTSGPPGAWWWVQQLFRTKSILNAGDTLKIIVNGFTGMIHIFGIPQEHHRLA